MKRRKSLFVTLFICACTLLPAQSNPWSLEDCIKYAVEHNITIKQLVLQKKSAEVDLNTSQMSRLPNLNASTGQNWNFGRTQVQSGLYENRSQSSTSFSVGSSMPIFTGFRIPNEIERNKLELEASVQNLEKAKEDLALNITSLFLQVLFSKELLKISNEQFILGQSQIERTRALLEAGKVPDSQMYDIKAQVANDKVSVIQAENNLRLALLDLAQSLELEQNADFDIVVPTFYDVIPEYFSSVQSPQAIFNNAMQIKPVVKVQELKVKSAEKTLAIAKSGYLPTLNLSMGIGTNYYYLYDKVYLSGPSGEKILIANESFSNQIKNKMGESIGLNLSIPIFNRFSVKNQVRSARLNIENQQLALDNVKKSLYKEIETAYLNAISAQEKYKAAQEAANSAAVSLQYAKVRYGEGKSTVFEFNESRTRLIRSDSERIRAKYDFIFCLKILDFYNGIEIKL